MEKLTGFPMVLQQEVRWGEMDALGHVNNTVYFKYFEDCRIAFFEYLGYPVVAETEEGPIVAHIECQFIRPLFYPDKIVIGCRVEKIGNTSLKLYHEIYSTTQKALVATGSSLLVMFNYKLNAKIPVSESLREKIKNLPVE